MDDSDRIAVIKNTTDPLELLSLFVEYESMLKGDRYYKDFQEALINQARLLTK